MSYDLMVFDQSVAPRERDDFLEWYDDVTQWGEGRDYKSPEGMTGNLRPFYDLMINHFPPMNGPDSVNRDRLDDPRVTGYTCAESAIYMGFAWSVTEVAHATVVKFAIEADVGFFDVSASDGVITHSAVELKDQKWKTEPVDVDWDRVLDAIIDRLYGRSE